MSDTVTTEREAIGLPGLRGKNVLVTGGSSGIGQAIAVRFAEFGANVAINYLRQPEEAAETEAQVRACSARVADMGVRDVLVGGDVSDEADVVRMVGEAIEGLGGLDILVNNAGIQISRPSEELSSADFDRVLAVNLRGAFLCAREAIRHFLAEDRAGSIVNVSSVHQVIPKPNYLGYSVSKGGMQNLTHTLALEYAARGIRVNGIGPGRPSRRSTAPGSTTPSSAAPSRSTSRCSAPARPTRWPASPASWPATWAPT
jgi:glucose 1-dehydrogenase